MPFIYLRLLVLKLDKSRVVKDKHCSNNLFILIVFEVSNEDKSNVVKLLQERNTSCISVI